MSYRYLSLPLCAALALTMLLATSDTARADAGDVKLVSRSAAGAEGNGTSERPSLSGGGRYVAFESTSTNLVPGITSGTRHVYRRDMASGGVQLCSSSSDDTEGNGSSSQASISADGTYVFFLSDSTNLIPGHPTAAGRDHVFRKDLVTGDVMLCSARPNGVEGNGDSLYCDCSADGRYVVFKSASTNLIPSMTTTGNQIFRKDLATGAVALCSANASGEQGTGGSDRPSLSSDGRYAAFLSTAPNLVSGVSGAQIYRKDLVTAEVALASSSVSGTTSNQPTDYPDISGNGRFVVFDSTATNLFTGTTPGRYNVFRKDLQTQEVYLCSSDSGGAEGDDASRFPSVNWDGRYVSFGTLSGNLSPDTTPGRNNIVRKDTVARGVDCCTVSAAGVKANAASYNAEIGSDGQFTAYDSYATNLVDGSPTTGHEVFRKELAAASNFFFAEGYTGAGFQEYLCLGNPGSSPADAVIAYLFNDGSPSDVDSVEVPAGSRVTVDVNGAVGAGREVSVLVSSRDAIVAERPIYFDYGPGWTGGHDVIGASHPDTSWYFAEGYTGAGFDEWICVLNPGQADAELTFRFQTQEAGEITRAGYQVRAGSRATFKVNEVLGAGYQASLTLQSDQPVVAERPMYFSYGSGWTGGHCVMGTDYLKREYCFAEGYTGTGFEEWLTLQNPNPMAVSVRAVYQFGDGAPPQSVDYEVPAGFRRTVYVPDEVGADRNVSVKLTCDLPFLAERPMYFSYDSGWTGGHCAIGASFRRSDFFFAEGYTGPGFDEWLCIQNPGVSTARVRITYYTQEEGPLPPREEDIPATSRVTINVNTHAGAGYQLSSRVEVLSGPFIIVERPMYFDFGGWTGGHDVVGYGL